MDIEDVKIGETYYVPFTVKAISDKYVTATTGGTLEAFLLVKNLHPIPSAPKYAPCRKFKEGDRVRPRERDGRAPWGRTISSVRCLNTSWTLNVRENEARGIVKCEDEDGIIFDISPFFLELVTPVEKLNPYSVGETTDYFSVDKDDEELSIYWKDKHPYAKATAEVECARLNAKWRKEHV